MLWHKGWLETRYRLLFALAFVAFLQILQHKPGASRRKASLDSSYSQTPCSWL